MLGKTVVDGYWPVYTAEVYITRGIVSNDLISTKFLRDQGRDVDFTVSAQEDRQY